MTKLEKELLLLIESKNIIEENYHLWFYLNEKRVSGKERLFPKVSTEQLEELIESSRPKKERQIPVVPPKDRSFLQEGIPIKPLTKLVREGTLGTCPKCKSTEIKRFGWFGKSIGCINPKCENYYE